MKTIRNELRDLMHRHGWTQYALAKASGVAQGTISRYLAGSRDVTTETADKLLKAARRKPPARK